MFPELRTGTLEDLLDERVHLMIRLNLIENGQPDPHRVAGLLKRKLSAIDREIDQVRRNVASGWRARALVKEERR